MNLGEAYIDFIDFHDDWHQDQNSGVLSGLENEAFDEQKANNSDWTR